MVASVAILGAAREGARGFGGGGASIFAFGVAMWLVLVGVGLALVGSVLRATTHHHALAGVTFALCALALAVGAMAVCARVVGLLKSASPPVRRASVVTISAALGLSVVGLAVGSARAGSHDAASVAQVGTVIDVLAFLLAAALAARQARVVRRMLALVGPPAVVVVMAVGVPALRYEPLRQILREKAPAFAAAAQVLSPAP
jgi:hypothetical protein